VAGPLDLEELDEPVSVDVGVRLLARIEVAVEPRRVAGAVVATAHRDVLRRVVHEPQGHRLPARLEEGDDDEREQEGRADDDADADDELDGRREDEAGVLGGRPKVGVWVVPRRAARARFASALLPEVLLDGVDEVLAADLRTVVRAVDQVGHTQHVLEAVGIAFLQVAAPGSIERPEGGEPVTAVDGRSGLAQLAVGVRSHGGEEPYRFRHGSDTHARGGPG
jgi:hypothetical protein